MNCKIRPMKASDAEIVIELERKIFSDAWSSTMVYDELDGDDFRRSYVMTLDEEIVGYAFLWIIQDEVHLNNFAIHPDFRRKGLGLKLISFIFDELYNKNFMFLEVRPSNKNAIGLYQKLGFREFRRRNKYYPDGEDAIVMQKKIS